MAGLWNDFNDATSQQSFDLIPKGTLAWVRLDIKPGGHNDPSMGWDGGYATLSKAGSGAVYLNCEAVIMGGPFDKRRVFFNIGLHSPKGPEWANMGRTFCRAILNSSRNIADKDQSPAAQQARRINGIGDLSGIYFLAKIDVEKDGNGDERNTIRSAVTPDMKGYFPLDHNTAIPAMPTATRAPSTPTAPPPAWAGNGGSNGNGYLPPPAGKPATPGPAWAQW